MQTKRSLWGNKGIRVSDACPTRMIDYRLGHVNVGWSDVEVEKLVRDGIADSNDERWNDKLADEAVRYALWVHHENQTEYHAVMGASL